MASTSSFRPYLDISKPFRRRAATSWLNNVSNNTSNRSCPSRVRSLFVTHSRPTDSTLDKTFNPVVSPDVPRWSQTPPLMKAPIPSRLVKPENAWHVNDDPRRLDKFYLRFLGPGGDEVLTDEVKWLVVTHKSFDHGRRGYNDRLAFLGRRIVTLQASLSLISTPPREGRTSTEDNPFANPSLANLPSLTSDSLSALLSHRRLAGLGRRHGMTDVIRWIPRLRTDIEKSGVELVMAEALYAVIGAIALQRGAAEAKKVARERILGPLGLS